MKRNPYPYSERWITAEDLRTLPRFLFWTVTILMVLLLAYPLSSGPALWLANGTGPIGAWIYFKTYEPLIAFAYDHPRFNDAMNWYLSWWGESVNLFECP